jgi:hypothetical protein
MRDKDRRFLWFVTIMAIIFLIMFCTSYQFKAYGFQRSVYDGTWTITFSDCRGAETVYDNCRVIDINEVFVTFTWGGRRAEIKLPVISGCSTTIMQRER